MILRKTEKWDRMFNLEDNIGLLVLKMIIWKERPLFAEEFFKLTDQLE